jgi:hypothetical protein
VVGQWARGPRAIGIAAARKCSYVVDELGFDGAIDYKNDDVTAGLCNTARPHRRLLRQRRRDPRCGVAADRAPRADRSAGRSRSNAVGGRGPTNYLALPSTTTMTGFTVDYPTLRRGPGPRWPAGTRRANARGHRRRLETFPETFLKLFSG